MRAAAAAASGVSAPAGALSMRDAPPIFFSVLPKRKRAVHGPKEKNASAGRSAPAQTSCRRRGMVGCHLRQSGAETRCPWGDLRPGEIWDTLCADFRCRWPVVDEGFSIDQRNNFYANPGSA